jgi:uncharacterized membrane protein
MKYLFAITIIVATIVLSQSCYYDNKEELYQFLISDCDTLNVTYSNQVVNTLNQQTCMNCHATAFAASSGGGIDLETYDNLKIYAQNGSLYGSVIHQSGFSPMPSAGVTIPECDQNIIKAWIDAGLPE